MLSLEEVIKAVSSLYGISAEISKLPGYDDENFGLTTASGERYILKVSPLNTNKEALQFQNSLLQHLEQSQLDVELPNVIPNSNGELISVYPSEEKRILRLLSWVDGRIWAKVNPKTANLRTHLGEQAGQVTNALLDFDHPKAHWETDWDLAKALWSEPHVHLFNSDEKEIVSQYHERFREILPTYNNLPKSVIHNDVNDYNILVSEDVRNLNVKGIIDFGDVIYTQTINDLAILLAYAIFDVPDPLEAALDVIRGYHTFYKPSEAELKCLYALVAMRLITTSTKALIRREEGETDPYYFVSEKPARKALKKWSLVAPEFAEYCFRDACGYTAHPNEIDFAKWAESQQLSFSNLFPAEEKEDIYLLDLKPSSTWLGSRHDFNDLEWFDHQIEVLQNKNPDKLIAGGYLEPRPLYTATTYDKEGNHGPENRTVHLGIDFWLPAGTAVHSLFDAEVVVAVNDIGFKEYGGLIILKHLEDDHTFYSLYGHLSAASVTNLHPGDSLKAGDCIGYLGTHEENGEWSPHLHFQLMLTLLDYENDFPGVTYPGQVSVWKSLCPDPNVLFKNENLVTRHNQSSHEVIDFRNKHLGKGLSISYSEPLYIVRGDGVYLMDSMGRNYLDTVNNVNHVGHQHPKVVAAGQQQMAVLNTNTRYLNEEIIRYAEKLLTKLPNELSVLHFVNSGSEANELAIRMAKTITGQTDMIAIEVGYHGNTNAVMAVSSYKFDGKGGRGKPGDTHILPMPDPFRGMFQGEKSGSAYARHAQQIVDELIKSDRAPAGFIGEPIISCGGQILPPEGYFKEVYQIVRDAGGLCIADEVQTSFGRVGSAFWAFELHNVLPDIVTMGKPVGNGHPLAVVACTREVADQFHTGMEFFNTFGGNPVSCAIGRAVLEVVEEENLQQNALEVGNYLKSELVKLQSEFPIIGDVRGVGLFLGFELTDSGKKPLADHARYLADRMKQLKILMSPDGPDHNVLKIKPPMIFSKENAKELIFRLKQVFDEDFMQHF